MKTLTVFTPTFNRAYILNQLYESLLRQTCKNFIWLIVDDGSTDDTKVLVKTWIEEDKIEISYVFQSNQGMHGAHNTAYKKIRSEWNTCIDSDDYMPDNAVDLILKNVKDLDSRFAGIVGLDFYKDGNVIGTKIPTDIKETTLSDLYQKYGVEGDKKLVYRTKIVQKYAPYPIFTGEKFVPLSYLYRLIDQEYVLKPINESLVIVEYLDDGSSLNMLKQYRRNPRGFALERISILMMSTNFKLKFKNAIHLVSCAMFVKDFNLLLRTKKPVQQLFILFAIPFGILLNFYIRIKTK